MIENYIFVAAHARSGSTYLCNLLAKIDQFKVYLEIFHYRLDVIEAHLHGDYRHIADSLYLPANAEAARAALAREPKRYLGALQQLNPGKVLAFKVFPGHLAAKPLRATISASRFVMLLWRNPVQSYISNEIAKRNNRWGWHDTSDESVEFVADDFRAHLATIERYYDQVMTIADELGIKVITFDYETLVRSEHPAELLMNHASSILSQKLTTSRAPVDIQRQDSRRLAEDKVSNPEELQELLASMDLSRLNRADEPFQAVEPGRMRL